MIYSSYTLGEFDQTAGYGGGQWKKMGGKSTKVEALHCYMWCNSWNSKGGDKPFQEGHRPPN
jgi:hypothetical protein